MLSKKRRVCSHTAWTSTTQHFLKCWKNCRANCSWRLEYFCIKWKTYLVKRKSINNERRKELSNAITFVQRRRAFYKVSAMRENSGKLVRRTSLKLKACGKIRFVFPDTNTTNSPPSSNIGMECCIRIRSICNFVLEAVLKQTAKLRWDFLISPQKSG